MANLQSTTLVSLSIAMWSSHGVANHAIKHAELRGNNSPHTASSWRRYELLATMSDCVAASMSAKKKCHDLNMQRWPHARWPCWLFMFHRITGQDRESWYVLHGKWSVPYVPSKSLRVLDSKGFKALVKRSKVRCKVFRQAAFQIMSLGCKAEWKQYNGRIASTLLVKWMVNAQKDKSFTLTKYTTGSGSKLEWNLHLPVFMDT